MWQTRMGDPLLAHSRRMPRGFQHRLLSNLTEPKRSMPASRLICFLIRVAIQNFERSCATVGHGIQAELRPMREEYS